MQISGLYRALIVSVVYLIFGCMWIILSDQAVFSVSRDPEEIYTIQLYKGLIFVVLSTIIIFSLHYFLYKKFRSKRIERLINELQQDNAVIREVIGQLPIGIAVHRSDTGEAIIVNEHFSKIYGWSQEELTGVDSFFERVYPDPEYRSLMKERVTGDIASGDRERMVWNDVRITTKSRDQRIVSARNIPLEEEGLMVSTVIDMTQMHMYGAHLDIAIEAAELGTWSLDMATGKTTMNQGWAKMLGYTQEEVDNDHDFFIGILHPDDLEILRSVEREILKKKRTEFSMEIRLRAKDGLYKWILDQGRVTKFDHNDKPIELAGIHLDISKRKGLEDELRHFFQLSQDLLCIARSDGYFEKVNPAFTRLLGYTESEMNEHKVIHFVHPDDRERTEREFEKLTTGTPTINFENRYVDRQGDIHWLRWSSTEATDTGLIYAAAKVITVQRAIQMELKESLARLSAAHDLAKLGYWQYDIEKDLMHWNEGMFDLFEAERNHFDSSQVFMLSMVHPDDKDRVKGFSPSDFAERDVLMMQFRILTPDGVIKWISQRVRVEKNGNSVVGARGVCQDVTERAIFLEEVKEQNKRLREIAWSQSHEVRAPLARIKSLIDLAKDEGLKEEKAEQFLDLLSNSANELDTIIHEINKKARMESGEHLN